MTLPLATTTVTVAVDTRTEPDGAPDYSAATGPHQAHISAPSGSEQTGGEGSERIDAQLYIDAGITLEHNAQITDLGTGLEYRIVWSQARQGLGLDHQVAGLVLVRGAVPA